MKKEQILIATIKSWNIKNAFLFKRKYRQDYKIKIITEREDLSGEFLRKLNPRYIFFPHWSWIIPRAIYKHYECVVFHMTDLPFGRGGSPLQNLILKGKKKTVISALRAKAGLDAGPVYLKAKLDLTGRAEEIYRRASELIYGQIIPRILEASPLPLPQKGRPTYFKRRKPAQSRIPDKADLKAAYNYIRMLDAEGYPPAFIDTLKLRFEFSKVTRKNKGLSANVNIIRKEGSR